MTPHPLSTQLRRLAKRLRPEIDAIRDLSESSAPAQGRRLVAWLDRCAALQPRAAREAALAEALRDLVTLCHAQMTFVPALREIGGRPEAIPAEDLGGAAALGFAVAEILRLVQAHDRDMARRLARETRAMHARQRDAIAHKIAWR